jgi:membrane fusion protein, heavy metal efflux system
MGLKNWARRRGPIFLIATALIVIAAAIASVGKNQPSPPSAEQSNEPGLATAKNTPAEPESLDLSEKQHVSIKIERVGEHTFPVEKRAVGSIDFNEDLSAQVFTPYQGKIIALFAKMGDEVRKGQTLFTIDSPDLLQAESTLIASAGVLELTVKNLERQRNLYKQNAAAQRDYEQAISDHQTAEGALKAARDAVRIFGKTDAEIDKVVADRKIDSSLIVPSPIDGRITARNAAPGLFVQPGTAPAPYVVTDISTMWMVANVIESDIPNYHVGQEVRVKVTAYPDRVFKGKISTISSLVDPSTHRVFVRSEIDDPGHLLLYGMYASFVIQTGEPVRATAVPVNAVVREGDGTRTAWATKDQRHFVKRIVEVGLQRDGYVQILKGLEPGEMIATDGAIFLSNLLILQSQL